MTISSNKRPDEHARFKAVNDILEENWAITTKFGDLKPILEEFDHFYRFIESRCGRVVRANQL